MGTIGRIEDFNVNEKNWSTYITRVGQFFKVNKVFPDDLHGNSNTQIIRKFINPAMYIERTIDMLPTYRHEGPSFNGDKSSCKIYSTKRCSCSVKPEECPCHQFSLEESSKFYSASSTSSSSVGCSKTDIENQSGTSTKTTCTSKDLKLPLTPLSSSRLSSNLSEEEKQQAMKNWLAKKDQERKKKQAAEAKQKEKKEKERQELLDKERENFKKWLMNKKREEVNKRKQKEIEIEEQKLKEAEKEKRQLENELSYQLWLKKKEEKWLDVKIKEELTLIKMAEEKEKRLAESDRAFDEWCKNSKFKQKPLPLNQGLESLKSSVSVSYINPIPWNSNIDLQQKPSSQ